MVNLMQGQAGTGGMGRVQRVHGPRRGGRGPLVRGPEHRGVECGARRAATCGSRAPWSASWAATQANPPTSSPCQGSGFGCPGGQERIRRETYAGKPLWVPMSPGGPLPPCMSWRRCCRGAVRTIGFDCLPACKSFAVRQVSAVSTSSEPCGPLEKLPLGWLVGRGGRTGRV